MPRLIVVLFLGLAACARVGATEPELADSATATPDAGRAPESACPAAPEDGFGTSIGATVLPFELSDCAGEPYAFHGDDFCAARVTVLTVDAGWCAPSRARE